MEDTVPVEIHPHIPTPELTRSCRVKPATRHDNGDEPPPEAAMLLPLAVGHAPLTSFRRIILSESSTDCFN